MQKRQKFKNSIIFQKIFSRIKICKNYPFIEVQGCLIKCQISACRKYVTTDSAQSHIYGQALVSKSGWKWPFLPSYECFSEPIYSILNHIFLEWNLRWEGEAEAFFHLWYVIVFIRLLIKIFSVCVTDSENLSEAGANLFFLLFFFFLNLLIAK